MIFGINSPNCLAVEFRRWEKQVNYCIAHGSQLLRKEPEIIITLCEANDAIIKAYESNPPRCCSAIKLRHSCSSFCTSIEQAESSVGCLQIYITNWYIVTFVYYLDD